MDIIPYFTHRKLVNWINEAGKSLGFEVKSERRRKTHGKIFQMDSMWFKNQRLFAFLEAEKRWEINHIIGHLMCCADYATQEKIHPFFILVFLENETNHCKRLDDTWKWLTRMVPSALKIRCLPIYTKRDEKMDRLYASTITKEFFNEKLKELIILR
ncbi:hypothetical protein KAI11_05715 [Candidatus Bathyarchaeota archaeon]|nr:hypothetical protein [Candidatus Bathyarchaeota archaeon]